MVNISQGGILELGVQKMLLGGWYKHVLFKIGYLLAYGTSIGFFFLSYRQSSTCWHFDLLFML